MKKIFTLVLVLLTFVSVNGQILLSESFDGNFPPSGWSIDAHAANWSAENTAFAGGTAPEAMFYYDPDFLGTSRLISPVIDLTGITTVLLQFNHYIDHYGDNYAVGVATRSGGGEWSSVWQLTVDVSLPATTELVPISVNTGSSDFQFCIYFEGNSYNLNWWSIDDITLTVPFNLDAAVWNTSVPTYFTGSEPVVATIANLGVTPVSTLNFNWQLDDGAVNTDLITSMDLTIGEFYQITSTQDVSPDAGVHNLKIWISDVNATSQPDEDPANDTLNKLLSIPTETLQRKPFYEEFTSSTCSPCAGFNSSIFNPFLDENGEELVYVKYQMDWPGAGDPYYTEEGGVRRSYYGVGFVPFLVAEGQNTATTSAGVNNAFNAAIDEPAFVDITSWYAIDGNQIMVDGQLLSYADLTDVTMHIVVFENITYENVATNGETEFHHVMMKMLPDAFGTSIESITTGEPFTFSHVYDMSTTFVEEMDDLGVAVFLQDNSDKSIFQAEYAHLSGVGITEKPAENIRIYPNPVNEVIHLDIPVSFGSKSLLEVSTVTGNIISSRFVSAGKSTITNDLPAGIYTIRLTNDKQQFTQKIISVK